MAKKDTDKEEDTKDSDDKALTKSTPLSKHEEKTEHHADERQVTGQMTAVKSSPQWPLITIAVFAGIVTVALVIVSWVVIASSLSDQRGRMHVGVNGSSGAPSFEGRQGTGYGGRGGMRGGMTMNTTQGVVTAINGDTITVSGRGKQVTVKKTDDTVISGDSESLAVNDTVIVIGDTEDDDSITATRIIIRNGTGGGMFEGSDVEVDSSTSAPNA